MIFNDFLCMRSTKRTYRFHGPELDEKWIPQEELGTEPHAGVASDGKSAYVIWPLRALFRVTPLTSNLPILVSAMEVHPHVAHARRQASTVSMMAYRKSIAREITAIPATNPILC